MTDATNPTTDEAEAVDAPESSDATLPFAKIAVIVAGIALAAIVAATQRDIATQPSLRGPRWLWHVIAATPPGVLLYGWFGTRGPEFDDLPEPTVHVVTPPSLGGASG